MWRPKEKDWVKVKREHCKTLTTLSGGQADCEHCPAKPMECNRSFEAGADAMLEAIWKLAEESPTGTFTFDTNTINIFKENDES